MLKLIIADDERVIRETISRLIDWESLGIELIGVCKDGIEVYNMILDESPDLVMTDIRMPGLSGLEVVKRIAQTNKQIQFIILSGYEEFDYAREAMKYGVKHYLLKPCSEKKLEEAIREASEDCLLLKRQTEERLRQNGMLQVIHQDAIYHLLVEGITYKEQEEEHFMERLEGLTESHSQYLDFDQSPCYLYYVYFLEQKYLEEVLERLAQHEERNGAASVFYGVYVKNTLLLMSYESGKGEFFKQCAGAAASLVEVEEKKFRSLTALLEKVLLGVRRFDTVYAIHNYKTIAILNNQSTIYYLQNIYEQIENGEEDYVKKCMEELLSITKEASQLEFLQMLGNGLCTRLLAVGIYAKAETTGFLQQVNQESDKEALRQLITDIISETQAKICGGTQDFGEVSERVMAYVQAHLSECDLTLKKIAEEHLYMNVDYVSRKFRQDTGRKFSQYLTEQRVRRAKELLAEDDSNKIVYVAEQVGCGNNPQYFSQIFKKVEGMTPAKWAEQMRK